jgi:hypothetical protein
MSLIKKLTLSSGIACLLLPMLPWAAVAQNSAQASPEETMDQTEAIVDQMFLSDVPLPGANAEEQQNRIKIKTEVSQWLGLYQGVQRDGDHYLVEFEQGSIPITMEFRENGDPDAINVVACPVTDVPIAQAPSEYRETLLAECPDLIP